MNICIETTSSKSLYQKGKYSSQDSAGWIIILSKIKTVFLLWQKLVYYKHYKVYIDC